MYLKKIELQGFKSFPDRLALDFDNVLAVIVGPNGSGKSNIADAVRWVLGEQSVKSLRGQKWEDVIFSGTQNRKALNFAEVTITLDNTGHEIELEFSDVTVTRKVFRSGESEYLINGKSCRLRDVRELFMDTGIGKEGYSIIGQGQIDDILNTRSDDRRQIFEEASGIVKFKSRRIEALTKLENERKNLVRLTDIITEIESTIDPLMKQAETAKRFLELSERLKLFEVNLFIIEEQRLKAEVSRLSGIYESNHALTEEKKILQDEFGQDLLRLKSEADVLTDEIAMQREKIYENRTSQEKRNNEIKINEGKTEYLRKDIERLNTEADELNGKSRKNIEDLELLKAKENKENLLYEVNEKTLLDMQSDFEKLNADLSVSEAEIERYKDEIIENIKMSSKVRSDVSQLKFEQEQAKAIIAQITDVKSKIRAIISQKQGMIAEMQEELAQNKQKRDSILLKKNSLLDKKNKLTERKNNFQAEYDSASKDVIKSKERLKVLTVMAQEHEGFFVSVKELLKASSIGILTGIKGVVGEIISVPKEYEIAVEIALGSSVQNIVTDDENAAKRAIEFLKRNKYGRATFLPIKMAKKQKEIQKPVLEYDGIIGTVKHLIGYDVEYENVLSSLLERVIVAENMQAAIDFSRKTNYSYRIVTLNGELITAQGAITGGSMSEKRINVFSRNREIVEIDTALKQLYKRRDNAEIQTKSADESITHVKAELDKIYVETEETNLLINTLEQRLATEMGENTSLDEQYAENEKEFVRVCEKQAELTKTINDKQVHLERIEAEGKTIEDSISKKQTLTQSDKELRDEKLSEIANLRIKSAEINSSIAALKADIDRITQENEIIATNAENCENEIVGMREKIKEFEMQIEDFKRDIDALKAICDTMEKEIVEKETRKLKAEEETNEIKGELIKLSELVSELTGENIRIESKKERLTEELQRLFDEMWDDYEITLKEARKCETIDEPPAKMQKSIKELKNEIKAMGNVNVSAIEQYKEAKQRYEFLSSQKIDILNAEEKLQEIITELTGLMEKTFAEQFVLISESFESVFKEMFGGGRARLELSDKDNPLESGIEIVAELPGKKLQNISLLSGGEKALTAIALLFGILNLKPSPFCILDEIEAALDDANITRFANYLKKLRNSTQFIVITHRKGTMEAANVLYGVTMEEQGVSKLISINLEEAVS